MKLKWKILIAVAAVLLISLVSAALFIDRIVRIGVETGASAVLATKTTLRSADLSVFGGSLEIRGLVIANPEGFGGDNLLELDRAYVSLKPSSLLGDVVEINEITLEGPVLKLRQQGLKTNLGVILDTLKGSEESPAGEESAGAKDLRVGLIRIEGAQLQYSLGGAPAVNAPIPKVELAELSTQDKALNLAKVIRQVLVAMGASAASLPGNVLPGEVTGALNSTVKGAEEGVRMTIEGVGRGATETVKGAENAIKGIAGLFKGDKEEEAEKPQE